MNTTGPNPFIAVPGTLAEFNEAIDSNDPRHIVRVIAQFTQKLSMGTMDIGELRREKYQISHDLINMGIVRANSSHAAAQVVPEESGYFDLICVGAAAVVSAGALLYIYYLKNRARPQEIEDDDSPPRRARISEESRRPRIDLPSRRVTPTDDEMKRQDEMMRRESRHRANLYPDLSPSAPDESTEEGRESMEPEEVVDERPSTTTRVRPLPVPPGGVAPRTGGRHGPGDLVAVPRRPLRSKTQPYGDDFLLVTNTSDDGEGMHLRAALKHAFDMLYNASAAMQQARGVSLPERDENATSVIVEEISSVFKGLGRPVSSATNVASKAMTVICRHCLSEKKL